MMLLLRVFFTLSLLFYAVLSSAESNPVSDSKTTNTVELHFFWSHFCPHCLESKPFIESLPKSYAWLQLHSYDLVDNPAGVQRYQKMAGELGRSSNSVPAFIFCGRMISGFQSLETTGELLKTQLLECHQNRLPKSNAQKVSLPLLGEINPEEISLPVFTLVIAALDAFNPCAFFVLFFLLSLLVHNHNRLRIATIGGVFVLFSGLMYFLFMTAWLNIFLLTQQLAYVTTIAGAVALVIAVINVKDYFFFKQGISLSIPDAAKPTLFKQMRRITQQGSFMAMLCATVVLAVVANSYELLCTAGLPMVYTHVLTLHGLSTAQYYGYLVFYNVIYCVPLLLIVGFFTYSLGSKKLTENQGRLLKLLSGLMMLGLGSILLIAPNWLNTMWVSIAVISIAIVLTLIVMLVEKMIIKRS